MAVVEMRKFALLGLKKEQNKILNALQKTKSVEFKQTRDFDFLTDGMGSGSGEDINEKLSRLTFAVNVIEEADRERAKYKDEKGAPKEKKPLFSLRPGITFDEFLSISENEYEIFSYVSEIEAFSAKLSEFKSEITKHFNAAEQMRIYGGIDLPLNTFKDTARAKIMLGTLPSEFEKQIAERFEKDSIAVIETFRSGTQCAAVVICAAADYGEVAQILAQYSFSRAAFDTDKTPKEVIEEKKALIEEIKKQRIEVLDQILKHKAHIQQIKLLYDYYSMAAFTGEQKKLFKSSASTFILEGFTPAESSEYLKETLLKETENILIEFSEVTVEDNPPILLKNSSLVEPFEAVTNLYSPPSYGERDPNLYLGIFFFIFFGIMMADAGYGLLLAIGAFFLLRKYKTEGNVKRVIKIIALGGVSTLLWGIVFGSWFALDLDAAADSGNIIAIALRSLRWFNPLEDPLKLMILSIGFGVAHILFGLGLKAAELIRKGKILDALMDVGTIYLFFIGVGLLVAGLSFGLYIIIAALALMVLTQGREKKGFFGKLTKGLTSIYGLVGYIGDIISYLRLFGLGIASAVVGLVMNTMAGMLLAEWYLAIFGVAVFLVGHIFNIALNVLGTYIHDSRLQYVEFFSRFYDGGGRSFVPYGSSLKYFNIK